MTRSAILESANDINNRASTASLRIVHVSGLISWQLQCRNALEAT